uniref:Uncharacterized protein n=1 Tax=Anopheles dirus TaxID=7168 RepID=A0A182NJN7_9DIPT
MDILPSGSIFRELQIIHETGCFSSESSFEDQWQQWTEELVTGFPGNFDHHDVERRPNRKPGFLVYS